jgi:hypothetical protein
MPQKCYIREAARKHSCRPMMIVQDNYDRIVNLLKADGSNNPIILDCVSSISLELTFSFFSDTDKVTKEHTLNIYSTRAGIEKNLRPESPFVVGYEELLPKLEKTELNHINICDITTEKGSYIIFTDYEYQAFIGILFSKRTLYEVREKMKGSERYVEHVFVDGTLVK